MQCASLSRSASSLFDNMKRTGRHPYRELTDKWVLQAKIPGRFADGNGLYLVVDPSGAKRWVLRTVINGRRRDMGLGSNQLVSLKDAREQAVKYRNIARAGGDPIAERKRAKVVAPTFSEAASTVHFGRKWKNAKHRNQWISSLKIYVFPRLERRRVDDVTTADILSVLEPIWISKPETARRVKQRIKAVMDYAKVANWRSGDNPVDGVVQVLPKQSELKSHHKAMPHTGVPEFIKKLWASNQTHLTKLAFEFLILTAARTNEILGATWGEINLENATWMIPASRMKASREHQVPLSRRAMEILGVAARNG
jgi:hypothetical protein